MSGLEGSWTYRDDEPRPLVVPPPETSAAQLRTVSGATVASGVAFVDEIPDTVAAAERLVQELWTEESARSRPEDVAYEVVNCYGYSYYVPDCDIQGQRCEVQGDNCDDGSGHYCFGPEIGTCDWTYEHWGNYCPDGSFIYVKRCYAGVCTRAPYSACY